MPFPTPEGLPEPGIEPASLVSPAMAGGFFTIVLPGLPKKMQTSGHTSATAMQDFCEQHGELLFFFKGLGNFQKLLLVSVDRTTTSANSGGVCFPK